MRKKPLVLIAGIVLLLSLSAFNYFQQREIINKNFKTYNETREKNLPSYLKMAQSLSKAVPLNEVRDRLEDLRIARHLDFFILQYKGSPVFWGTANGEPDLVNVPYQRKNELIRTENTSFMSVPIGEHYLLTAGNYWNRELYHKLSMEKVGSSLVQEIILFSAISLAILLYYLKDIFQILELFNQKNRNRDYKKIQTHSAESEKIVRGLVSYEKTVESLVQQNEAFSRQILPSLKKEILSGKKPPYDFKCTLVRTDINNFSHIYNQYDVSQFMSVINEMFTEVSHVVSKYGGMIHEFVGDEVLFYFKDDDHLNSPLIAMGALREINEIASRFHQRTMKEYGYPFTVKSSLAHGTVRFGPLVNGYSLAGSVLIETVRILSHVVEKDENVVYFDENLLGKIQPLCEVQEAGEVQLKGFSGVRKLFSYRKHQDLKETLQTLNPISIGNLTYYRSDLDLSEVIEIMRKQQESLPIENLMKITEVLRSFSLTKTNGKPVIELIEWLEKMLLESQHQDSERVFRLISSNCMLLMNLLPKDQFDSGWEARLAKFASHRDKRIVANIVEVLTFFKSATDSKLIESLLSHEDNRIAANALIHEGIKELKSEVIKSLQKMLSSKDASFVASGLYALGELAKYHRSQDAVYYSNQLPFLKLVRSIPAFLLNADIKVRRQAFLAANKAQDDKVSIQIQEIVRKDASGQLQKEALEVFVEQKFDGQFAPVKAG